MNKHIHQWNPVDKDHEWGFTCLCGAFKSGVTGKIYHPVPKPVKGTPKADALRGMYPTATSSEKLLIDRYAAMELELNEALYDFHLARAATVWDVQDKEALLERESKS